MGDSRLSDSYAIYRFDATGVARM